MYTYIHIYIWICVFLCVVGGQRRELSAASLTGVRVSRRTSLFILVQRPYKELCTCKTGRRDEGCWSVRSETQELKVRHSELRMWVQSSQRRVRSQEWRHRAVKTITRWVSIFGCLLEFSLSSCNCYKHT